MKKTITIILSVVLSCLLTSFVVYGVLSLSKSFKTNTVTFSNFDMDIRISSDITKSIDTNTLSFKDSNGDVVDKFILNETYYLDEFRVVNTGDYPISYKISVKGDEKLVKALNINITNSTSEYLPCESYSKVKVSVTINEDNYTSVAGKSYDGLEFIVSASLANEEYD